MMKFSLVRSTLAFVAATAMAGAAVAKTPDGFTQQDRDDVTCLIIVAAMLEDMNGNAESTPEEQSGLSSVITYFLGKVVGRHRETGIGEILHPDFVLTLPVDSPAETQRCSREAAKMGEDFVKAGEALQAVE